MLRDVVPTVRAALHNSVFTNMTVITEQQMCAINLALYKILATAPTVELGEGEFYQKTSDRKYLVNKISAQNEGLGGLVRACVSFCFHLMLHYMYILISCLTQY